MNIILRFSKQKLVFYLITVICFSSCLEEYDLYLPSDEGYLSIDVLISTKDTIQYAYVKKSYDADFALESDGHNNLVRMYASFQSIDCEVKVVDEETQIEYDFEKREYILEEGVKAVDYVLNGFTPAVGKTYTAKVKYNGKTYQSTQTVHKGPIIDKITFKPYYTADEEDIFRPFIHITDPNPKETDYYFFVELDWFGTHFHRDSYSAYYVPYSILSDEGMTGTNEGIELSLGMGAEENQKTTGMRYFHYEIMSISKENYEFFEEMKKQLTNDGGVYTPCPVTPPTNFTGGKVVGQFIATDAKIYDIYPDESNIVK